MNQLTFYLMLCHNSKMIKSMRDESHEQNNNELLLRIPISKVFLIFLVFEELHKDFVSFTNEAQIVEG